jgi:hypothetical protein
MADLGSQLQLPVSVKILQLLAYTFDKDEVLFHKDSKEHQSLKHIFATEDTLNSCPEFANSPLFIRHIQALMLACLSMLGGIHIPVIFDLRANPKQCRITWDSGTTDSFQFGVLDDNFFKFSKYFQQRVFGHPGATKDIPTTFFEPMKHLLESYGLILNALDNRIKPLLVSRGALLTLFDHPFNQDLLFILISSLPTEQMNALFLHIQSHFPNDLEVTTPSGNKVNVCSMLQTPSTNTDYLIEKTHVYLDLYFSGKYPIIREITQQKTKDFLKKSLQHQATYDETADTLRRLKHNHVDIRLNLYTFLSQHLGHFA